MKPIVDSTGLGIYFENKERIDETVFFEKACALFHRHGLRRGKTIMGPSEDIIMWDLDGESVALSNDLNYGVFINVQNKDALSKIISFFLQS